MISDPNQFWNLLLSSELLPEPQIRQLISEYKATKQPANPKKQAAWLISNKSISEYHAQVLLEGHDGPFRYGKYDVTGRFQKGSLGPLYHAVHRTTKHPVVLEFFPGFNETDLKNWHRIEPIVERASRIDAKELLSAFESIILPHHRFVAGERPVGALMAEKLPLKSRVPWRQSCALFSQIASALAQLHANDIVHGALSPRTVWIHKSGLAQLRLSLQTDKKFESPDPDAKDSECQFDYLAPERKADDVHGSVPGDVYALGCTLIRMISGRIPYAGNTIEEIRERHASHAPPQLEKYELPTAFLQLIHSMVAKKPENRPTDLHDVSRTLAEFGEHAPEKIAFKQPATLAPYLETIRQFQPGSQSAIEEPISVDTETASAPAEVELHQVINPDVTTKQPIASDRGSSTTATHRRRKKDNWKIPAAIAGALALLLSIIGILVWQASQTVVAIPNQASSNQAGTSDNSDSTDQSSSSDTTDSNSSQSTANSNGASENTSAIRPTLYQQLIPDDRESLWESPTTGPPVDFAAIPAAAKIIFVFRPADLLAQPEGPRVIRSLGPQFESLIQRFEKYCGLALPDIEQVIVSLHSTPEFEFEPFFIITTAQPLESDRLLQLWNRPSGEENSIGQNYYVGGDTGYYFLHDSRATDSTSSGNTVSKFAIGPKALIEEVADVAGASALAGPMKLMSEWTDAQRNVNVLYLRPALFNDEGQKLMGPQLSNFNRELSILIPDFVRGGLLSLHLDDGTYLEAMFHRSLDLKADELKDQLSGQMRTQRDRLTQFVASIPSSSYWDKVRLKYDNMLTDLFRNQRWEIEHGEVVTNAWLPPMAAHNLIAASELVMSFSSGAGAAIAAPAATDPQTMKELLAVRRDLNIANPPDLNLLMSDIESEINDDFSGLPFEFRIRLMGSDLQKDGITKNQRPSPLDIKQKPLSEILTQIMVAANPSKDITGPEDPNCKLIWVVADDPDNPGQPAVLITTRAGAAEKNYELPSQFREGS